MTFKWTFLLTPPPVIDRDSCRCAFHDGLDMKLPLYIGIGRCAKAGLEAKPIQCGLRIVQLIGQ